LLRFEHESTLYRIAMHVTQFFDPLLFGEHHEIVETMLPDVGRSLVTLLGFKHYLIE
jgi:hypothetical protein